MELQKLLSKIQNELKAPKNQRNTFGNYNYRSCEDILEAVKPLLENSILTISDKVEQIGERYYVKASATISLGEEIFSVDAYAREAEEQKGMSVSQITGSASSYARKYALNGLFLIDDTKDDDTADNTHNEFKNAVEKPQGQKQAIQEPHYSEDDGKPWITDILFDEAIRKSIDAGIVKLGTPVEDVMKLLRTKYKVAKIYNAKVQMAIDNYIVR